MGVCDEDEIDGRQVLDVDAGVAVALLRSHPLRPDRIDEGVEMRRANEETGVPDPDDLDLVGGESGKNRGMLAAGGFAFPHHRREEAAAEIAIVPDRPPLLREHTNAAAIAE